MPIIREHFATDAAELVLLTDLTITPIQLSLGYKVGECALTHGNHKKHFDAVVRAEFQRDNSADKLNAAMPQGSLASNRVKPGFADKSFVVMLAALDDTYAANSMAVLYAHAFEYVTFIKVGAGRLSAQVISDQMNRFRVNFHEITRTITKSAGETAADFLSRQV